MQGLQAQRKTPERKGSDMHKPTHAERPRREVAGRTQASKERSPGPRLPHERDQSADSQTAPPVPQADIGEQAFADAGSAREDTGRMPVTDRTYRKQTRPPR
jgi:hypothetical protein